MKATIIGILVVVLILVVALQFKNSDPITYVKQQVEVQEAQPVEIVPEDTIEKARKDLERINAELDAKEQDLLKQRDVIDSELERLRETRVSFQ